MGGSAGTYTSLLSRRQLLMTKEEGYYQLVAATAAVIVQLCVPLLQSVGKRVHAWPGLSQDSFLTREEHASGSGPAKGGQTKITSRFN